MPTEPICETADGEPVRLDEASLEILQILRLNDREASTGTVREEHSSLDRNQTIQYRIDDKLRPAGLVESRKEEHPRYRLGVNVHRLTTAGLSFLDTNQEILENVRSNAEAVDALNDVQDVTVRLYERVEDVERKVTGVAEDVDRLDNRERSHNSKRKRRISELVTENEKLRERVTELEKQFWILKQLLEESEAIGDPGRRYKEEWG